MSGEKIKVLFISSWFQSRVKPVFSQFVLRHAKAASLYAEVTFLHVCFDKNQKNSKFEIIESTIDDINIIHIYIKKPFNIFYKIFLYLKAYKKGFNFVSEKYGKPAIIHGNVLFPVGLACILLKSFRKTPFVFTEHWSGYLPENPIKIGFIKKYLIKKIARRSSALIPVSENLAKAMIDLDIQGNYLVIPNVVNTSIFTAFSKKTNHYKKILHISSLIDEAKNITGILKVIKNLSLKRDDFSLHIVSHGNKKPFIEMADQFSLLNKIVFFENGKNSDEIAAIMKTSDCFLQFSNYENLPCVILEALSCGLPVIATDVGAISGLINEKFGILVKPKDTEGLFKAIENMLENPEYFDRKNMHEFVENNFSYQNVGKKFYNLYSDILVKNLNE